MITTVKPPCCERIQCRLISMLFQLTPKNRRSGMDRRNLGSMDGGVWWHPCNLDAFGTSVSLTLRAAKPCKSAILPICPAIHAGMTQS